MGLAPFCQIKVLDFYPNCYPNAEVDHMSLFAALLACPKPKKDCADFYQSRKNCGCEERGEMKNSCCPDSIDLSTANSPTLSQSAALKGFYILFNLCLFLSSAATVGGPHFRRKVALLTANQRAIKVSREADGKKEELEPAVPPKLLAQKKILWLRFG